MPHGSIPGERRGGRQAGTLNKATEAKQLPLHEALALAFAQLGPEKIDTMSPANLQLHAMRELFKQGYCHAAMAIADRVAPYFDPKLASEVHRVFTDDSKRSADDIDAELAAIRSAAKDAAESAKHDADADEAARASARAGEVEEGVPEQSHGVVH
jgi:hypothetical protein